MSVALRVSSLLRDSSNESGATDAVGLSMSMSEIEDPEIRGKKKRGRPGKQPLVGVCVHGSQFEASGCRMHVFVGLIPPHLTDISLGADVQ